jgi:hypothetical protein
MPYRRITLPSETGIPETHWVRVSDAAVAEWLRERDRLRALGYPDRPPEVDGPTLRAWLPRPGEQDHPYFAGRSPAWPITESIWPVYTAVWHAHDRATTKVLVSAAGDGAIVSRVLIEHPSGERRVDKVKVYPPDCDPSAVWGEVEVLIMAIDAAPLGWGPEDPLVTDYGDYLRLDAEVETAEAEARAAGLVAPEWVH